MNGLAKRNNKFDVIEKELIKIKLSVQALRIDTERVCVEYDKLRNKFSFSELRHEDLVEKLKNESWRVMFVQQEEDHLGAEDTIEKIDEENKLEVTEERCEE